MSMTELIQLLYPSAVYTRIGGVIKWQDSRPAPTVEEINEAAIANGCEERVESVI